MYRTVAPSPFRAHAGHPDTRARVAFAAARAGIRGDRHALARDGARAVDVGLRADRHDDASAVAVSTTSSSCSSFTCSAARRAGFRRRATAEALAAIPGSRGVDQHRPGCETTSRPGQDIDVRESFSHTPPGSSSFSASAPAWDGCRRPTKGEREASRSSATTSGQQLFANRTEIADAHLSIRGRSYAIVGVLPTHANAPIGANIWVRQGAGYRSWTWLRRRATACGSFTGRDVQPRRQCTLMERFDPVVWPPQRQAVRRAHWTPCARRRLR